VLPSGGEERRSESLRQMAATFADVVVTFFRKRNILLLLLFIFLYRAGEGQVIKIGPLFLQADRSTGGLGLTLQQFGTIYGTFGSAAFILGSILGGYFTSWLGLKRALLPLLCILNLPMLAYWYLSAALPTNPVPITIAMSVEMFGYGFGFVGVILLMMQEIAPGQYQTAHYAFANSLMNLGVILPGAVSGWIQTQLGYRNFFIWVLISAVPALLLSRFVPIRGGATPPPTEPA
jgi:MFS transporter, PAT family, beta-lactamase induction signal transducer AmpG